MDLKCQISSSVALKQPVKSEKLDLHSACRLCLINQGTLLDIFKPGLEAEEIPLSVKLTTISPVPIKETDEITKKICSNCVYAVNQSYSLWGQIKQSDDYLRRIYYNEQSGKDERNFDDYPEYMVPEVVFKDGIQHCCKMEPGDLISMNEARKAKSESSDWEEDDTEPLTALTKNENVRTRTKRRQAHGKRTLKKVDSAENPKMKRKGRVKLPSIVICHICNMPTSRQKLKLHLMVHSGEKPHLCDTCGKGFTWKFALDTHKRVHTGEKPYLCKECGMSFRSSSRFSEHSSVHTGIKPHVCEVCAMSFRTSSSLKKHTRKHTGEKPYKCSFCDRCFSVRYNLKQHMRLHTGDKNPISCTMCSQGFSRRKFLEEHVKIHHSISEPKFAPQLNST